MKNLFIVSWALFLVNSNCVCQIVNQKSLEQYCNQNEKKILKEFNKYIVSDSTIPYQMFMNNSNEVFVFQYDEKSDKCNGKLIQNGNTYQVYGSYGASESEGTFFGVLTEKNQVKGIIRWYYFIDENSQNNYDGVSLNRIENGKDFSSNLHLISTATCYDEYEINMIGTAEKYRVNEKGFAVNYYQADHINFSYSESDNYVQGNLTIKGSKCDVYGIYMGEGMYFGSVWFNGNSKGVLYWDYSDSCIVLTNKIDCKTFESEVCKTEKPINNTLFGSGGNGTNGGFVTGKNEGIGIGQEPRKRITKLNLEHINVSESVLIDFKVNINRNGDVTSVYHLPSGMKVIDPVIIEELKNAILTQLKYEKSNEISSDRIKIELRKK
jgi:hypothetical protein